MHDLPMMIDVDEALRLVTACVTPGPVEDVPLVGAWGRTLAAPIHTDVDDPPFDRATMDGFAVRAADVTATPVLLHVIGDAPAGNVWQGIVGAGEAVRINTGAPLPPGADAVVRVEDTVSSGDPTTVQINAAVPEGNFVTRRGAHVSIGGVVLVSGTLMSPGAVGVAAAAGATIVRVYRKPRVALIATGNELVEPGVALQAGQIRNSNRYLLEALVRSAGAEPILSDVVPDDRSTLIERVRSGLDADVLCLTGGISMGTADLVPETLTACGVSIRFRKMAIKPGRPTLFGVARKGTLVFALPGNPVSAFVGFELLVRPALALRQGRNDVRPVWVQARTRQPLGATTTRRTLIPAVLDVDEEGLLHAQPTIWHGSGDVFGLGRSDALMMRPPHAAAIDRGDVVHVYPLSSHSYLPCSLPSVVSGSPSS